MGNYRGREAQTQKILEFFDHIYGGGQGYICIRSWKYGVDGGAKNTFNELFAYPTEAKAAAERAADRDRAGRDVYAGVNLFATGANGRASNVCETTNVLGIDTDHGRIPADGPQPTYTLESSPGKRQDYFKLSRPIPVEEARDLKRRLAGYAGGEVAATDHARVLRVPATHNRKPEHRGAAVEGALTGVECWDPETLDQAIPLEPREEKKEHEPYTGPPGAALELGKFLEEAGVEVLGEEPDDKGRKLSIICPWADEHTTSPRSGTFAGQYSDGALWFACYHGHCEGRGWRDFRAAVDPRPKGGGGARPETLEAVERLAAEVVDSPWKGRDYPQQTNALKSCRELAVSLVKFARERGTLTDAGEIRVATSHMELSIEMNVTEVTVRRNIYRMEAGIHDTISIVRDNADRKEGHRGAFIISSKINPPSEAAKTNPLATPLNGNKRVSFEHAPLSAPRMARTKPKWYWEAGEKIRSVVYRLGPGWGQLQDVIEARGQKNGEGGVEMNVGELADRLETKPHSLHKRLARPREWGVCNYRPGTPRREGVVELPPDWFDRLFLIMVETEEEADRQKRIREYDRKRLRLRIRTMFYTRRIPPREIAARLEVGFSLVMAALKNPPEGEVEPEGATPATEADVSEEDLADICQRRRDRNNTDPATGEILAPPPEAARRGMNAYERKVAAAMKRAQSAFSGADARKESRPTFSPTIAIPTELHALGCGCVWCGRAYALPRCVKLGAR